MNLETVREFCLSLPHAEEEIKWENDLTFMVGRKIFAVLALEPGESTCCCFKCEPPTYAELVEREGIIPAPYLARYHWVGLESFDAVGDEELQDLIKTSYELVWRKLSQKVRKELGPPG